MFSFLNTLSEKTFRVFMLMLVVSAVFLLYLPSLGNGFVYDDEGQILENPYIKDIRYLPRALTSCIWEAKLPACEGYTSYYRPLHALSYLFTYAISGSAAWFHFVNIAYYAVLSCGVFLLFHTLLKNRAATLAASFLFVLHPIHSEAVMWVASVPELLAAAFAVFSFLAYLSAPRYRHELSALFYLCALFGKETALGLPLLFIFYDFLFGEKKLNLAYFKNYAFHGAAAALYFALRFLVIGARIPHAPLSFKEQILNGAYVFGEYLKKMLYPYPLNPFIPFESITSAASKEFFTGLVFFFVFLVLFVFSLYRRKKVLAFGLGFYIVFFLPALAFHFTGNLVIGERYLLLPSIGLALIAGHYLGKALERAPKFFPAFAGILLLGIFGVYGKITYAQNSVWRSSETFYRYIHEQNVKRGYLTDATYYNLALIYEKKGMREEAKKIYEEIIKNERKIPTDKEKAYNNLGIHYLQNGETDKAIEYFEKSIELNPGNIVVYGSLGYASALKGMRVEALKNYLTALRIHYRQYNSAVQTPQSAKILNNIRLLYGELATLPRSLQNENILRSFFTELLRTKEWLAWEYAPIERQKPADLREEILFLKEQKAQENGFLRVVIGVNPGAKKVLSQKMMFYAIDGRVYLIPEEFKTLTFSPQLPEISLEIPFSRIKPLTNSAELYVLLADFRYYKFSIVI